VPTFHFDIVEKIKAATGKPLVLHGGSGSGPENIKRSVECGINKINVGTDYMIAQREFVAKALAENPDYDYPELLHQSYLEGSKVIERYMELAGSANKAF
jgi:fructose-bisphosphate aldolase class II